MIVPVVPESVISVVLKVPVLIGSANTTWNVAELTYVVTACVGAACCYGISSVLMRRLPDVDPIGLSTLILIIAAGIVVPLALIVEGPPPLPDSRTLVVMAFLGLIPTAAANMLRVLVIRSAGPVFMSLTNYQVPVWSVVLGAWILGEPLPASLLGALVLILSGVGLSQYGAFRRVFGRTRKLK